MILKFAAVLPARLVLTAVLFVTMLAGTASVRAQETSAQQAPAQQTPSQTPPAQPPSAQQSDNQQSGSQQSSSQEVPPEETTRRVKPKNYKNWTFNVGGGANLTNGTTEKFARGGGGVGAAGVARNLSQYFGFRADFQFDNLPLRQSALELAQAPSASSQVYTIMVDPIINIPATKDWSGYIVFGGNYLHRSGKLDSSTALPGSACNPFFLWWGNCFNNSLPLDGDFLSAHQNEFGYNFGAGIARKVRGNLEIYGEFRYVHGSHNSITTDFRPITIGVRW
jgi:opacity protein-like surface antigen